MKIRHVFISYVKENLELVRRLSDELSKYGVTVWLDKNEIKPGSRWKDAIREAIRKGDFFIACFSKEYISRQKTYMNEELTLAIEELRKYPTSRTWFIPVLLNECEVPDRNIGAGETLRDLQHVKLYKDWDTGIQRILSVIKPISPKIQHLITTLYSKNVDIRRQAIIALGQGGEMEQLEDIIEILKTLRTNRQPMWSEELKALKDAFGAHDSEDWTKCRSALLVYIEYMSDSFLLFDLSKWNLRHLFRWLKMLEVTGLRNESEDDLFFIFHQRLEDQILNRIPAKFRLAYKDYPEQLSPGFIRMLENHAKDPADDKLWREINKFLEKALDTEDQTGTLP